MAALQLALVLLATVLASAVLDQLIPRLSLPLIQIACGIAVALLAHERITVTLNPELFLVLFIAPLLFHEAVEADKTSLWKNRASMLSYAIGLVVAIVLVVGFSVNALAPSIPLAAAFALGGALGPTDPIAVASISQRADIPKRQQTTLQGESLINDASGIVSFQFAVAAVVTGTFSALEAVGAFLIEFFGALAAGIVLGLVLAKFAEKVRDLGLENTTFHVCLEIITPFAAYLLGEVLHVSGVIMVVACGITMSLFPRTLSPASARMSIVSSSVWKVITFALNGVVFVMLGTQLPQSFGGLWVYEGISNFDLVILVVAITVLMHATRFIWTLLAETLPFGSSYERKGERAVDDGTSTRGEAGTDVSGGGQDERKAENASGQAPARRGLKARLRSAAVMTFAGSKGAITLAIMFSLPIYINTGSSVEGFPQRDLLIFLSCGVILLSLLMATFAVPLLAPRKDDASATRERDDEARAEVFRRVIEGLTARQTPENRAALGAVISRYSARLERYKEEKALEDESDVELRAKVLEWEQEYVLDLVEADEIPPLEGYRYISRAARVESLLKRGKNRRLAFLNWKRRMRIVSRKFQNKLMRRKHGEGSKTSGRIMRDIQVRASMHVVDLLKAEMVESDLQSEKISQLIREYERNLALLRGPAPSITALTRKADVDLDAVKLGLQLELEEIQAAYEDGRLSRAAAQKMRENVYLMQADLGDYV